jgi:hypothetical protein
VHGRRHHRRQPGRFQDGKEGQVPAHLRRPVARPSAGTGVRRHRNRWGAGQGPCAAMLSPAK